jgi:hypothetical protein
MYGRDMATHTSERTGPRTRTVYLTTEEHAETEAMLSGRTRPKFILASGTPDEFTLNPYLYAMTRTFEESVDGLDAKPWLDAIDHFNATIRPLVKAKARACIYYGRVVQITYTHDRSPIKLTVWA